MNCCIWTNCHWIIVFELVVNELLYTNRSGPRHLCRDDPCLDVLLFREPSVRAEASNLEPLHREVHSTDATRLSTVKSTTLMPPTLAAKPKLLQNPRSSSGAHLNHRNETSRDEATVAGETWEVSIAWQSARQCQPAHTSDHGFLGSRALPLGDLLTK